jgi:endonuclease YncB( thermonuclease family)
MMFEHDYKNYPELTNAEIQELGFTSPHKQIEEDFIATVVKVHDGDTITLKTDFRDFTFPIRFSDIDAPELSEGGDEARDWLKGKIEGQEVQVLINKKNRVEKWGRLLGRIQYRGMIMGDEEMYLGLAKPYGTIKEGQVPSINKTIKEIKWA